VRRLRYGLPQQPIIRPTGVVDTIEVDHASLNQAAQLQQWCQSRPLRASRDASKHSTAPTSRPQSPATRRSKPGRATKPLAERPRSSSITSISRKPRCRATRS
jgi:hypothetical protein